MAEKKEYPVPDLCIGFIELLLMNNADEPITDTECKIIFKDNQEITAKTDANGTIKFIKLAKGEFKVILQEEDLDDESENDDEEGKNQ